MEPSEQQQTVQVMPTVLGNGQQIILQSLQQQLNANGQQSIQVVPIIQGGQGTSYIVQPQQSQPQIVQLPDGQTFIYHQPVQMAEAQQAQPQIVNINGSFFQIPAQQTVQTATLQNQANTTTSPVQQTQQVVMIPAQQAEPQQMQQNASNVNNFNTNNATSPPPQPSTSSTPTPTVESEEEPLYVNASKFYKDNLSMTTIF
jgi:nuclear transcription factor Y, alpha